MTRWTAVPLGLVLTVLAACGGGGVGPTPAGFSIVASTPLANATAVALDSIVVVTFSKPIDPATATPDVLTVTSAAQGAVAGSAALLDAGDGRTLTWYGLGLLTPNADHTCRVHPGVRSLEGEPVTGESFFNFRTRFETGTPNLPDPSQLRRTQGSLHRGRQGHEATRLDDGRVLISGGFTRGTAATDSAEVYLPAGEVFSELMARMTHARAGHTATRLADGRVLLAGGWYEPSAGQQAVTATAELFDPSTNTFSAVGDMTKARTDHAALLLPDGRVLITGGSRLDGSFLTDFQDAELFDPGARAFSLHPAAMIHTRSTHGMVDRGDGTFFLGGGSDADLRYGRYDTATSRFEDLGAAPSDLPRFGPALAVFASGAVAIAGGEVTGTVLHVFPESGQVLNTGSGLTRPRAFATATRIGDDRILVAGGTDFSATRSGFLEPSVDLLVEGGVGGSRTFGTNVRFPHGMSGHTATVLESGDVLYCGGVNSVGTEANHVEGFLFLLSAP